MRQSLLIVLLLFTSIAYSQTEKLVTIRSQKAKPGHYAYAEDLQSLIGGEKWGYHSGQIGIASASSTLKDQGLNNYQIDNLYDLDLQTAWIEGKQDYGIGEFLTFIFDWKDEHSGYGKVYNFAGIVEVFNGYCKSETAWKENSRVKTFKVYLNNRPICNVELFDTWQYQSFDISKYLDNPQDGDTLRFEIIEVFKGNKYEDTAISELVFESTGN